MHQDIIIYVGTYKFLAGLSGLFALTWYFARRLSRFETKMEKIEKRMDGVEHRLENVENRLITLAYQSK